MVTGVSPVHFGAATVLDVKRGKEADAIARSEMGYGYEGLIEDQEFISVLVEVEMMGGDKNKTEILFLDWHFSLRYREDGEDYEPEYCTCNRFAEDYPPLKGTGWIFFKVKVGTEPHLFFAPDLSPLLLRGVKPITLRNFAQTNVFAGGSYVSLKVAG